LPRFCIALNLGSSVGVGLKLSPPGPAGALMSGASCVSHGMFGRKTGRFEGLIGRTPSIGKSV
jgi:hypothetical protein